MHAQACTKDGMPWARAQQQKVEGVSKGCRLGADNAPPIRASPDELAFGMHLVIVERDGLLPLRATAISPYAPTQVSRLE